MLRRGEGCSSSLQRRAVCCWRRDMPRCLPLLLSYATMLSPTAEIVVARVIQFRHAVCSSSQRHLRHAYASAFMLRLVAVGSPPRKRRRFFCQNEARMGGQFSRHASAGALCFASASFVGAHTLYVARAPAVPEKRRVGATTRRCRHALLMMAAAEGKEMSRRGALIECGGYWATGEAVAQEAKQREVHVTSFSAFAAPHAVITGTVSLQSDGVQCGSRVSPQRGLCRRYASGSRHNRGTRCCCAAAFSATFSVRHASVCSVRRDVP